MFMEKYKNIAIIDIGKTNAKLVLVDAKTLNELEVRSIANDVIDAKPYPHYDTQKTWEFILEGLTYYQLEYGVSAISITSHGAALALLADDGKLAAPILDYEHEWPENLVKEYDRVRPSFSETGSPRLSNGLNLGAQLYYQFKTIDGLFDRTQKIVTYAQYWAYALTGVAACEVTSLGCHTDLWSPEKNDFSSMVRELGWLEKFADVKSANEILGPVTSDICKRTGLKKETPVFCGIHDSNASLFPYLQSNVKSFSVVSTGTWVITMSVGGKEIELNENQDTLINVNALGEKVPSARFMGGREFEILMNGIDVNYDENDVGSVLEKQIMIMPSVEPSTGPFQGMQMHWSVEPELISEGERAVAASFYLALMTSVCLDITGADGVIYLEGPMSKNIALKQMLFAVTGRNVVSSKGTGTSTGAAMLCGVKLQAETQKIRVNDDALALQNRDACMQKYGSTWLKMCDA